MPPRPWAAGASDRGTARARPRRSFDVLDLLADLVDQHLQLDRGARGARIDGLRAEGVGLAVEFLQQEVEPAPDRLFLPEHTTQFGDVTVEAVELLVDVEL